MFLAIKSRATILVDPLRTLVARRTTQLRRVASDVAVTSQSRTFSTRIVNSLFLRVIRIENWTFKPVT